MPNGWRKPMLPTLADELPVGPDWRYEIKYDGYRAILYASEAGLQLISRNLNPLAAEFPEVIAGINALKPKLSPFMPVVIDGELCVLTTEKKADFAAIQTRGRLKASDRIRQAAEQLPAHFLAFDLLQCNGAELANQPYAERKRSLAELMLALDRPLHVDSASPVPLQYIPSQQDPEAIVTEMKQAGCEGIVAKKLMGRWLAGARTREWIKVKNWKEANVILTAYEKTNGFFRVAVSQAGKLIDVGVVSHGFQPEERQALIEVVKRNKAGETPERIAIAPGLCLQVKFLELYKATLRQPRFDRFRFDLKWEECTWEQLLRSDSK